MELVERIAGFDAIGVVHRKDLSEFATAMSQAHCFPVLQGAHQRTGLRAQLGGRSRFHGGSLTQASVLCQEAHAYQAEQLAALLVPLVWAVFGQVQWHIEKA